MIYDGGAPDYWYRSASEIMRSNDDPFLKRDIENFLSKYMLSDFNEFLVVRKNEFKSFNDKKKHYSNIFFLYTYNEFSHKCEQDKENYSNLGTIIDHSYRIYSRMSYKVNDIIRQEYQIKKRYFKDLRYDIREYNKFTLKKETFYLIKELFKDYIDFIINDNNKKTLINNKTKYISENLIKQF